MWPLHVVGETMRTVGHAVPQAWAMDGWIILIFDGGSVSDLGPDLGVLALFAIAVPGTGARVLNRSFTH